MADVLSGKLSPLPYDIQTEQARLLRQRQIVDALMKQSMASYSPVIDTGAYKVANWGDAVGRVADAYAANKRGKDLDTQEATVAKDYNHRLETGVQDFMKGMQGYRGTTGAGVTGSLDQQDMPIDPSVEQNPMKAVAQAMGSGVPDLKGMAAPYLTAMMKGQMDPKTLFEHQKNLDPKASALWAKTMGLPYGEEMFTPPAQTHLADDVVVSTQGPNVIGRAPVQSFNPKPINFGGVDVPAQQGSVTGKMAGIGGIGTNLPALSGEGAFEKGLAESQIKELQDRRDLIQKAVNNLPMNLNVPNLVSNAFAGAPWSGLQSTVAKALNAAGIYPDAQGRIPATELLTSTLGKRLLENTRPLGSGNGFSDKDLTFLKGAEGADLTKDPRTLTALAAVNIAGTMNQVDMQNRVTEQVAMTRGGDTAKKVGYFNPEFKMQLTPQQQQQFQIYQLPSGQWSTHLTDDISWMQQAAPQAPQAPQVAPAAAPTSGINSLIDKYAPRR